MYNWKRKKILCKCKNDGNHSDRFYSTYNTDRDNHLKSADFFNVEIHPTITFEASSLNNEVTGNLTSMELQKQSRWMLISTVSKLIHTEIQEPDFLLKEKLT